MDYGSQLSGRVVSSSVPALNATLRATRPFPAQVCVSKVSEQRPFRLAAASVGLGSLPPFAANSLNGGCESDATIADGFQSVC